jgi:tetratricopeptide (TPR) repeat protein
MRRSREEYWMRILLIPVGVLSVLIALLGGLVWGVRAMPGRYASYLPESLLGLRQVPHSNTLLRPTLSPSPEALPATATATATVMPTATSTATPGPTATPIPSPTPLPSAYHLTGLRHERQGWNNCGPTTLAMQLSFWGRTETQREIAPVLKPDPEDKNVSPEEMAAYVRSLGMAAVVRYGGDEALLKQLLLHDFPVIIETWYVHAANDQMGHYRLVVGYDDAAAQFSTYDSLHDPEIILGYQELDELWRGFNRIYLVAYPPEREAELAALLGPAMDEATADQGALETALAETRSPAAECVAYADCGDGEMFSWFNVGTSYAALGQLNEAAAAYDQARTLGTPYRIIWYEFGPYAAYYGVGRYEDVIALADETLRVTPNLEESYYWRGRARRALGDSEGARSDFQRALGYHPGWMPAQTELDQLP